MTPELEQFKKKIEAYSIVQLEEIVMSIDKHKYPEKLAVARDVLIAKKLEIPSPILQEAPSAKEGIPQDSAENTQLLPPVLDALPQKEEKLPLETQAKPVLKGNYTDSKKSQWLFWLLSGFAGLTSVIAVYFILLPHTQWAGKDLWVREGSQITAISLTEPKKEEVVQPQAAESVKDNEEPSEEDSQ